MASNLNSTKTLNKYEDTTSSEHELCVKSKYELKNALKEKLANIPEVLDFIQMLQKYIEKQKKKLKKLKSKVKKLKQHKHVSTQTESDNAYIYDENAEASGENATNEPKSIADDIKEAAEMAMQNSGFVYEETSGMYYDYTTGYYYNAEYGLYYDGNSGTYLKYDQETKTYEFHSQVEISQQITLPKNKTNKKSKRKKNNGAINKESKRLRLGDKSSQKTVDIEEGECSQSSDSHVSEDEEISDTSDVSKQWPPCMRIIIESSTVPKVKVGSLHIITCNGGTIGREGDHSLVIPDINTSKHHLKFAFDKESGYYTATDLGSRNGTTLNGKRMSPSKQESESMEVTHGSKIQIGSTVLLCHIHEGNQTCGHCEPGLIQTNEVVPEKINKTSKIESHKNELKKLRKKFGVSNYEDDSKKVPSGYKDRAQKRRDTVGSQNPHEKTKVASLDESIPSENKGFKMLAKMGWKEGQSLGKDNEGLLEPIKVVSNKGNAGVGSNQPDLPVIDEKKQLIWTKTQERFQKLPNTNVAFDPESSD